MDEVQVKENIKNLAQDNADVVVVWIYGSRAKQTASLESDYDLAIAFNTFPQDTLQRRLRPEILAIDWAALPPFIEKTLTKILMVGFYALFLLRFLLTHCVFLFFQKK